MVRRVKAIGQLALLLTLLLVVKLIRWASDQKSFVAFVAVGVVPVAIVLLLGFGLWAGTQWGSIAATIITIGGFVAIAMLILSAGQLIRVESIARRNP